MNRIYCIILVLLLSFGCRGEYIYSNDPYGCGHHHGTMLNNLPPGEFNEHMKKIHGQEFGRNHKKCSIDHLKLYNLDNGSLEDHLKHCELFKEEKETKVVDVKEQKKSEKKDSYVNAVYDESNNFYQSGKTWREHTKFIPDNYSIMTKCGDYITITQTTCSENHKSERYKKDIDALFRHFKEVHGLDVEHTGYTEKIK